MSVAVIFSFLSSMRAGHYSSICTCVSVVLPHAVQVGSVFLLWQHPCSGTKYCIACSNGI